MHHRRLPLPGVLLLLSLSLPPVADAQVRRCTAPDGTEVYTDRRCEELGAVERRADAAVPPPARLYRSGCSRTLRDLAFELRSAVEAHDVNRLAGIYHWAGMANRAAYAVMGRLDAIAQRPLVDIVPLYAGAGAAPEDYYPQATVRRAPSGLRLEQTLANGTTPAATAFALRRHLGCWWLSL